PGFVGLSKQFANRVVNAHVRCGIRAWRAANRRLIDVDYVVDDLVTLQRIVSSCQYAAVVAQRGKLSVNDVVDKRTFSRARSTSHTHQDAERNLHIKVQQIVVSRSTNSQGLAIRCAALPWHFDFLVGSQIGTGE